MPILTNLGITEYNLSEVIMMTKKPDPGLKCCGYCTYFVRHYVKIESRFVAIPAGHCACIRLKNRKEKDTCPNWKPIGEEWVLPSQRQKG